VTVAVVDYSDKKSLQDALSGVDVVVSVLSRQALVDNQLALFEASKAAGVKRFVPSDWGTEVVVDDPKDLCEHMVFAMKRKMGKIVRESKDIEWTQFFTGPFTDWFLSPVFGFDWANAKFAVPGDGSTRVATSSVATIAKLVPHILNDPKSKNVGLAIADDVFSWNDAIAYFEKISGKKASRTSVPQAEYERQIKEDKSGNPFATFGTKLTLYAMTHETPKNLFNREHFPKIEVIPATKIIDGIWEAEKSKSK